MKNLKIFVAFAVEDGVANALAQAEGAGIRLIDKAPRKGAASEALLGGLMPYTNVRLIGTQTHGKYCTGWMLSAEDMYEKCPQVL